MSVDTAKTNGKRAGQNRTQPGRSRSLSTRQAASLSARQIATLASALIERYQFASQHGISHVGARDLYEAGGYPRKLTNAHYLDLYERGDIAERLVEAYPKATWVPGASIFEDEDPDNITPWEIKVNNAFDQSGLDIWNVFKRADILARLGENGYSVILIGDKTRTPLDQEISDSIDFDSLIYLQPLHQKNASILEWDEDVYSERYSYPLFYQLKLGSGKGRKSSTLKVHWSRVIHFTEGGLDNPIYGPPALRSIFNRLMDKEKVYTGGSEAAWKRMDPGVAYSTKNDADLGATDEEIEQAIKEFREQLEEFRNGGTRDLLLNNMDVTQLTAPVHNFGSNIDSLIKAVAGAKGFPQRKLTGSEEAQLASEQDRSNYRDEIELRQSLVALPHTRIFVDRVGRDNPPEWDIYWPTKGELNDHEKAELVKILGEANKAHYDATGEILYTANEIRDKVGDGPLDEIDQEISDPGVREDDDQSISASRTVGIDRMRSLKSGRVRTLLSRKRAHIDRKLKSRGIVLVDVHRSLSHADDRSEQAAVRRIADTSRSSFASLMRDLWSETFTDDDSETLRLSLDNQSRAESFAMSKIDEMEERMRERVNDRYLSIIERVGKATLRVVEKRKSFSARRPIGRFNTSQSNNDADAQSRSLKLMDFSITNPRAIAWAQSRSSALITEIMPDTRAAVRSIISDGIKEGRAPRVIAREIRERVGLRTDQLDTLAKFKAEGASESQIERRAKQLLRQRSELIARTETMNASNSGLREMWHQAVDNDLLPSDVKREWIATEDERTRDEHADLDGEQTGLNEAFSLGFEPGQEPACRCSQGIV